MCNLWLLFFVLLFRCSLVWLLSACVTVQNFLLVGRKNKKIKLKNGLVKRTDAELTER